MTELGIGPDRAHPNLLTVDAVQASDVVVTLLTDLSEHATRAPACDRRPRSATSRKRRPARFPAGYP
jgi:hypothetical protein